LLKPLYAILLDGGYLTKKLRQRLGRAPTADDIMIECERLQGLPHVEGYELLRIYYYDAAPSSELVHKPVTQTTYNLGETERFRQSQILLDHLVMKPNIALRLGRLDVSFHKWRLKPAVVGDLIAAPRALTDNDFDLDLTQKGVDMRIGMDMARLALRQMVRAVIVVTGDADFVPAFKYVRREGVKVILEPLGGGGRRELREHADIVLEARRRPRKRSRKLDGEGAVDAEAA
jgi:uncharacterized LabA/DUF88 family protein